jgi:uncharacterized protein YbbK (DUF523 family)
VGVSSCLLGALVRFNGGHKRSRFLADELGPYVDWVPYRPASAARGLAGQSARRSAMTCSTVRRPSAAKAGFETA